MKKRSKKFCTIHGKLKAKDIKTVRNTKVSANGKKKVYHYVTCQLCAKEYLFNWRKKKTKKNRKRGK